MDLLEPGVHASAADASRWRMLLQQAGTSKSGCPASTSTLPACRNFSMAATLNMCVRFLLANTCERVQVGRALGAPWV